jgi:phosphonate transport system substrate-binding protein
MGLPVSGFVTFDHAAAVEALRNGDADISFMGALPFVLAVSCSPELFFPRYCRR